MSALPMQTDAILRIFGSKERLQDNLKRSNSFLEFPASKNAPSLTTIFGLLASLLFVFFPFNPYLAKNTLSIQSFRTFAAKCWYS